MTNALNQIKLIKCCHAKLRIKLNKATFYDIKQICLIELVCESQFETLLKNYKSDVAKAIIFSIDHIFIIWNIATLLVHKHATMTNLLFGQWYFILRLKKKNNLAVPALAVFTSHNLAAINQSPKLHTQTWEWLPGLVIYVSYSLLCMAFLSPKVEVILSQNNSSLFIIHTVAPRKWQSGKSTHLLFPPCTDGHYNEMPWGPVMQKLHKLYSVYQHIRGSIYLPKWINFTCSMDK